MDEDAELTSTIAIAFHQSFLDSPASHGLLIRRNARGALLCRAKAGVLNADDDEQSVLVLLRVYLDPDDFR